MDNTRKCHLTFLEHPIGSRCISGICQYFETIDKMSYLMTFSQKHIFCPVYLKEEMMQSGYIHSYLVHINNKFMFQKNASIT